MKVNALSSLISVMVIGVETLVELEASVNGCFYIVVTVEGQRLRGSVYDGCSLVPPFFCCLCWFLYREKTLVFFNLKAGNQGFNYDCQNVGIKKLIQGIKIQSPDYSWCIEE